MKKEKLVNFMAKIMEKSGFKVYKGFKASRYVVDIYGTLPTVFGDIGVVVTCKNYDERWKVGLDVIKEMEMVAKALKASKIVIVTTSEYTKQARSYATRRDVKLIDREGIISLAQKFSKKTHEPEKELEDEFKTAWHHPEFINEQKKIFIRKKSMIPISRLLKGLSQNLIFLILVVVGLSIGLTTFINTLIKLDNSALGILKIFFSFIFSYVTTFIGEKEATFVLLRGTVVFFISLLILIILIIF